MTGTKEHNDEVLRKLTEKNKIAEFAMQTLGMDERRAEVFGAACGSFFTWDGTLKFKGASGQVPADDPSCTGFFQFFQREYSFLVPPKTNGDGNPQVDPALLAAARSGNLTAKGRLLRDSFHGDVVALDKALADKGRGTTKLRPILLTAVTHQTLSQNSVGLTAASTKP
jgi:hypothetical protein